MKTSLCRMIAMVCILAVGIMAVSPFVLQEAYGGADEVIKVTTLFHVKVGNSELGPIADCGIISWVTYEPVVGNGSGHYYDYHIMNTPGHSSHGCATVGSATYGPYDYFVESCSGY